MMVYLKDVRLVTEYVLFPLFFETITVIPRIYQNLISPRFKMRGFLELVVQYEIVMNS
jgi:hypothetical protein